MCNAGVPCGRRRCRVLRAMRNLSMVRLSEDRTLPPSTCPATWCTARFNPRPIRRQNVVSRPDPYLREFVNQIQLIWQLRRWGLTPRFATRSTCVMIPTCYNKYICNPSSARIEWKPVSPKIHTSLEVFFREPMPREATRREVEQALGHFGFELQSNKGSHYLWQHPDGTRIGYALRGGRRVGAAAVKDISMEIRRRGLGD